MTPRTVHLIFAVNLIKTLGTTSACNLAEPAGQLPDGVHAELVQGAQVVNDTIAGLATLFRIPVALAQMDGGVFPSSVSLAVKADEHRLQYIDINTLCQAISCMYNTLR